MPVGHDDHPALGQAVLDAPDGNLVARDLAAGEQDDVTRLKRNRVGAFGDAGERSARLALPSSRHDQHLSARRVHRGFEVDHLWQVLQVARGLGCTDDPVKRAPGNAQAPPGLARHLAQRVQPRHVGGKGGDQHPAALMLGDFGQKPALDDAFGTRRFGIENIG